MKLKDSFITHKENDKETIVSIDDSFNGIIKANSTASFIIDELKEETTMELIVSKLLDNYEVSYDTAYKCVCDIINKLKSVNAIEE